MNKIPTVEIFQSAKATVYRPYNITGWGDLDRWGWGNSPIWHNLSMMCSRCGVSESDRLRLLASTLLKEYENLKAEHIDMLSKSTFIPVTSLPDDKATVCKVSQRRMLANAQRELKKQYAGRPLWALVKAITGYGSTTSTQICMECGWNPEQDCSVDIL